MQKRIRVERRKSTQRFALLPERGNVHIKYLLKWEWNPQYNCRVYSRSLVPLRHDWPQI